ncbi:Peptidase family M48 [Thermanaerovibrio velox DSM 12556]|uniref:Peptidase family M48 n=1 Tax=Thermanaerovibrio velox DSM 12556 TaxID=926567 RepID=H0URA2_9BACT|nr:Peptidase family M48 [Thermanaerovibrio velox DSM 12556]
MRCLARIYRRPPSGRGAVFYGLLFAAFFLYLVLTAPLPGFALREAWGADSTCPGDVKREIRLGEELAKEVESRFHLLADPVVLSRLDAIKARLEGGLERGIHYSFRVVDDPVPNAFALPGGFCYVTSGLLKLLGSDSELAAVMAHEMVHVDRCHGMIQAARNQRLSLVALGVALATKGQTAAVVLSNLAQIAVMNSYSRDLEREADLKGLDLLIRGGYSPSGMVTALEKLWNYQIRRPYVDPGIYMDHPEMEDRIAYILKAMGSKGLRVSRKEPLGILSVRFVGGGNSCKVTVDNRVWLEDDLSKEQMLKEISKRLDRALLFETMPQEITVSKEGVLSVRGQRIISKEELPGVDLDSLRAALVKFLMDAKGMHPISKSY